MTAGTRRDPWGSLVMVLYGMQSVDLAWVPENVPVFLIHNDAAFDRASVADRPLLHHLGSGENVGFGAGVNLALEAIETERVVICNPDTQLEPHHWSGLSGEPRDLVTVPLADGHGRSTSVIAPYWTPLALAGTSLRLGNRLAPLGTRRRRGLAIVTGRGWLAAQESELGRSGVWPLSERWVSGAVFSVDTARLRSVGGFDERYFLYFEDVDLCRRLAVAFPDMVARVADTAPGVHQVGGSGNSPKVEAIRRSAAVTYGAAQSGLGWLPYQLLSRLARHTRREARVP